MKKRRLSILLSIVMLFSLLPTTALAEDTYPKAGEVCVDGSKYFGEPGAYYFKNNESACSKNSTGYNAYYNPTTGTLTLDGYDGGSITVGGTKSKITVVLVGNNTINNGSLTSAWGGDITITSSNGGTLSITKTMDYSGAATGIEAGYGGSQTTGNVTIMGDAKVIIDMTHNGTSTYEKAYGIFARENITISENASADITCATPKNTTGGDYCNGLYAAKNVIIDTNGTIKIDVTNAGKDENNGYSFGVFPMGTATLTKVENMEVKWKKVANNSNYPGGAFKGKASIDPGTHAINVDKDNCFASYRKGAPYTVTVNNGDLAGPGVVPYAKNNGEFLAGDKVNIKPSEKKSSDGTLIPFKEWTAEGVTFDSPVAAASNSFTVHDKNVTVTAKHNPFVGTPVFKSTSNASGTIEVKTVAKPDNSEFFQYVKDGETTYQRPYSEPETTSTESPYQYIFNVTTYSAGDIKNLEAGDYRMAVTLNDERYLSEPFTVSYTAAPTPTAIVGNVTIDGTTGTAITEKEVVITLTNDKFNTIAAGTDVKGWFTNLPAGLEAKIKTAVNDKDTTATIEISGNPSATSSEPLAIKIPEANLVTSASDLDVTSNANAVFAITTPITEGLVPVDGLTGKTYNGLAQEPSFSGTLTRGTDYTVSYAVKSGSTGNLDSDNKPVGAGTYVVTVTGKGSYTGSFTKNFKIDKANPDYTAPTAKTGLAYTGTALDLIDAGTVTNGGEMQYRLSTGSYGTTIPTATDAGDYIVYYQITGNNNYNAVAGTQVGTKAITVAPADQNAPTGLGVAAPTANGRNGKITGTTTAMEYNTDAAATSGWTACSDTATEVAPGTYYVRNKADANHNAGAVSAALVVPAYSATRYNVTVTHDTNGTASADKTSAVASETVTLTATPNSGYVFDKWADKTPTSLTINTDGTFTMPSENVSVKATFKGAALTGTVNITGDLKYGAELTATLTGSNNTGNLDYKWYQNGTTQIATNNTGKYTLRADDIGKTITVKVSSNVQTGEIIGSTTGTIDKADGPAAPAAFTLGFTLNSDGKTFTATIPTVTGGEYSFDGATYSATNTKTDCAANTGYTGYVRIAETNTHKVSATTSSTQTSPMLTVAAPTFTPDGASSFTGTQNVIISCTTAGATIYYTTDGTPPTDSSTKYTTDLSLTSTTTVKAIAIKTGMNDSTIATATFTKASGGASFGGGYVPTVQKPEITIIGSGKADLSADGRTATITAAAGHELVSVVLNGKEMGKVEKLTGLKTGDKATITFQAKTDGKAEMDKMIAQKASKLTLMARSAKTAKLNIKVVVKGDLKAITDAGYTVKYKFYRSTKKSAGYKAMLTKKAPTYFNTYGKKGTMYYYKARVMIYDKDGNFVAQTALKQCKYANRLWTK